ncbi:hypothetical protein ANRL1_03372 [Anaerolineae bacterium]|nr:hypothetical protein ANRL1_03372 [Anaerolineae bacterium]
MKSQKWFVVVLAVLAIALVACSTPSKPTVAITSALGGQVPEGQDVPVQSSASDAKGITRIELAVDNEIVKVDTATPPQQTYSVVQNWKATPGQHTLSVRAYNVNNVASDSVAFGVSVMPGATAVPAPTGAATAVMPTQVAPTVPPVPAGPTPTPGPGQCTNNAAFIADVTVPDGTPWQPNQGFNKIWRVQNNGSCTWNAKYQLVFLNGTRMTTVAQVGVTGNVAPGQSYDPQVALNAPATPGDYTGQWQLRDESGAFFGPVLVVKIKTIIPVPPPQASVTSPGNGFGGSTSTPVHVTFQGVGNTELTSVSLYANGALLTKQTSRAATRTISGAFDWRPTVPGNYELKAIAVDIYGQQSASAIVGTISATPPTPTCVMSVNFRADRTVITAGEHTILRWDVDCVNAVYLDGQGIAGHGTRDVAPGGTQTWTLHVIKQDNSAQDFRVTISVNPAPVPTTIPPTAVPQRRSISGTWRSGNYAFELTEALGCGGPQCGVAGRFIETHGVTTPTIEDVSGSFNVYSGAASLIIARPGASGINCPVAANSASMTCSGSFGTLTFTK